MNSAEKNKPMSFRTIVKYLQAHAGWPDKPLRLSVNDVLRMPPPTEVRNTALELQILAKDPFVRPYRDELFNAVYALSLLTTLITEKDSNWLCPMCTEMERQFPVSVSALKRRRSEEYAAIWSGENPKRVTEAESMNIYHYLLLDYFWDAIGTRSIDALVQGPDISNADKSALAWAFFSMPYGLLNRDPDKPVRTTQRGKDVYELAYPGRDHHPGAGPKRVFRAVLSQTRNIPSHNRRCAELADSAIEAMEPTSKAHARLIASLRSQLARIQRSTTPSKAEKADG